MGTKMTKKITRFIAPFNGPIEIGLRAISILSEAYPTGYSLQRLIICDYLSVHSDDIIGGPKGLHPKTPHRSSELLVRRDVLQKGLLLYMGKGLAVQQFQKNGITYAATEETGSFLDMLHTIIDVRLSFALFCCTMQPSEKTAFALSCVFPQYALVVSQLVSISASRLAKGKHKWPIERRQSTLASITAQVAQNAMTVSLTSVSTSLTSLRGS